MQKIRPLILTCAWLLFINTSKAQDSTSRTDTILSFPDKFFNAIDKKAANVESKLAKQTEKYLNKISRQENKLKKKLCKKDSLLAKELFEGVNEQYNALKLSANSSKLNLLYSGHLDSLATALSFLKSNQLTNLSIDRSIDGLKSLQDKLNATEEIKKYLAIRQQRLKDKFQKLGMVKELKQFRKQVYYYQAQVREYKAIFEDPNKLEAKLMELFTSLPAFKEFFPANSQYGSMFRIPTFSQSNISFAGLQIRSSVQQVVSSNTIGNSQQFLGKQLQNSRNSLNKEKHDFDLALRKKLKDPLGFVPNSQKAKPFLKRFEKGANVTFGRVNKFLPTSADVAFTLGYKLNDKSILGIGSSYKIGLGKGIEDIQFSSQGYSFRSFLDWKLKGSIYATGGYEKIYFSSRQIQNVSFQQWQESGLLGISKKYMVSKNVKGSVQCSYDFLSYKAVPKRQPIIFRLGYNF